MTAAARAFRGTSRFEVLSKVGEGAGGFVYEVVDRERNSRLALKTLRTTDAETILLLKNEFRAIQDLDHPNLVIPKELFEENGQWFFTMDYVEGENFLSWVRPDRPSHPSATEPASVSRVRAAETDAAAERAAVAGVLDERRLRAALRQLAAGLCALHASHKVHRDIKPSNILVTSAGKVLILDFGIVTEVTSADVGESDSLVGTIPYMAPEQAEGGAVAPAADWYAVGVILYQALTGRLPFSGSVEDVIAQKVSEEPPPPDAVVPSLPKDLVALCVDLLRLDPAQRIEGFEVLERLGGSLSTDVHGAARPSAFVGRRAELASIEAAFARTKEGHAVTVLIEGESGVGKSFLVRELTTRLASHDAALVFRGRCYERESVPYKAVDSLIDDLSRFLASLREEDAAALLPAQAGLLQRLFPVLETVPAVRATRITHLDVQNPQEMRARMFEVLRELFVNIARHHRLVLVIDDLQWADADSFALLAALLRPPSAPPLLLLASIRSGTERARRGEGLHDRTGRLTGDVRTIRLEALPPGDARDLIRQLLEASGESRDLPRDIDAILGEAKGHPLFIDELVRHRLTHKEPAATSRLDDALWERASALPAAARRLLELVAIAGVPLPQQVAAKATALELGQVFDSVTALRAANFVRTSGVYRKDTVEAYHDRVRESVLRRIDDATRKEWHGRLAIALEQSPDVDPEMLVTHWHGAGNSARAAEYAIRAAGNAASALAFDHAAALYQRALELETPRGEAAKELRVRLAEALTNAGRGGEAARAYLEAAGSETTNAALDLRRRAGEEFMCSGHFDEGAATLDAVLLAAGVRTPRSQLGVLLSLIVFSIVLAVRGLKFKPRPPEALDPRDLLIIDCLYSAGSGFGMTDHVRGKEFQLRMLLFALRTGDPARVCRALAFYAAANAGGGGPAYARTMQMHAVAQAMATELKQPFLEAMILTITAYAALFTGRYARARDAFIAAEAIFRDQCVGVTYELSSVRALLCRTYGSLGEIDVLASRAEVTLREARARGDRFTEVNLRCASTSVVALLGDDTSGAQQELDAAAAHLSKRGFHVQHYFHLHAEASLWIYAGDPARAHETLVATWPAVKRSMLLHVQPIRLALHDIGGRAALALARSRGDASGALRKVAASHARAMEREKMPWATAQAGLLRAGLAELAGQRALALEHLTAAEAGFSSCDMALLRAVAQRRRGLVMGGEEGPALVRTADAWLAGQRVTRPAKVCALYAPGFDEA